MRSREDLVRQLLGCRRTQTASRISRPARSAPSSERTSASTQTQQALLERIGELERRIHELREERERLDAVDAERERDAKGHRRRAWRRRSTPAR